MRELCALIAERCVWIFGLLLLVSLPAHAQRPLGTDVSGYQTSVNWTTVKDGGVSFAWSKASQGTKYTYPSTFPSQAAGAKSVGIYFGAYHYATPSANPNITGANSADSEAAFFWGQASNYVKYGGSYLVPMLDWEDVGVSNQLTAAQMSAWANEWCLSVSNYARTNGVILRPVIYTGTWYSEPSSSYPGLTTAITNWPNWMAAYPADAIAQSGAPSSSYPWPSWRIWQYGDTNWSGGDSDVYNGTLASFVQSFVIGGTNAPVITCPGNLSVNQGSNATFLNAVSGTGPVTNHWLFDGTLISGITSSNYTITNVQLSDAGRYTLVAGNSYATISNTVFLSVIAPLTNSTGSVLAPPGLANWWPADGNANDIFGTYNGTPNNGLSYTTGEQGLAFHFDGASSYIQINGAVTNPPNWTVCMWVNRSTAPGASACLMGDATYALKLEQYNATHEVGFSKSGVSDYLFSPAYTAPAGVWTHLAFVGTASGITLYTNGVQEGAISATGLALPRAYLGVDTFSGSPSDYLLGSLDEVQVYNAALTAAQIKSIYSAHAAGLIRAPEFTGIEPAGTGGIKLSLEGMTSKTFTLHASTNLINWTSLGTFPNSTGTIQYVDAGTNQQRFFQVSQP